jgi:hypothetical protein
MRGYVRQLILGSEDLFLPVVLRAADNLGLFREIGHSFLRERGSDDLAGQVLHGLFFSGMNSWIAENLKTGMPPGVEQMNMIGSN